MQKTKKYIIMFSSERIKENVFLHPTFFYASRIAKFHVIFRNVCNTSRLFRICCRDSKTCARESRMHESQENEEKKRVAAKVDLCVIPQVGTRRCETNKFQTKRDSSQTCTRG